MLPQSLSLAVLIILPCAIDSYMADNKEVWSLTYLTRSSGKLMDR